MSEKDNFDEMPDRDLLLYLCASNAKQGEQITGLKETLSRHLNHHWASYLAIGTIIFGFVVTK